MYLVKPDRTHKSTVTKFISCCLGEGDSKSTVAGSSELAQILFETGFDAWVERVRLNGMARREGMRSGIEPGHTFLIVERLGDITGEFAKYMEQFPLFENGDSLIGIVTFRAIHSPSEGNDVDDLGSDAAYLNLCVLPEWRDTASYMLIMQSILTHVVCEGLPYKHVSCVCQEINAEPNATLQTALIKCNFVYIDNLDVYTVDLSAAHQLKSRIQAWGREE